MPRRSKQTSQLRRIQRLQKHKRAALAEHSLQRLLLDQPRNPVIHFELGRLTESRPKTSERWYLQALNINDRYAEAWYRLGMSYEARALFMKAVMAYTAYLRLRPRPSSANIYLRLGHCLDQLNREAAAIEYYLKALAIEQGKPGILFSLAQSLQHLGDMDLALDCLMSLGKLYPERLGLTSLLMGYMLEKQGEFEAAQQCFEDAVRRQPRQLFWELKRDLAYPLIPDSREAIDAINVQIETVLERALARLRQQPAQLPPQHFFYLGMLHGNIVHTAYHHTLPLRQRRLVGELVRRALPKPVPFEASARSSGKIRLGVMIASRSVGLSHFYAGCTLDRLDPERFEVVLFCQSQNIASLFSPAHPSYIKSPNVSWEMLPEDIYQAAEDLRQARLDVMYFTEPAWDFSQTVLAVFRVAPVQCTSWMSPGTSGLDTMDYFLSSSCMEPENPQAQYSERLELWPTFPSWIRTIVMPPRCPRSDFGLEDDWTIYACLQNLMKFHPDFDLVVAEILRQDPNGRLVMVSAKERSRLAERLMQRFKRRIPDVMDRIWIFPELSNMDFLNLLQNADIALDPLYYGGGTTAYQALSAGLPVVSLPGERMVGRITSGLYGLMGIDDTLVDSHQAYIDKAVALSRDPAWREDLRQRTLSRLGLIYQDERAISHMSEFLERVSRP